MVCRIVPGKVLTHPAPLIISFVIHNIMKRNDGHHGVSMLLMLLLVLDYSNCFLPPPPSSRYDQLVVLSMGRRSFGAAPKIVIDARIDFRNFWLRSIANFTVCERPTRTPDYESWSGSLYWDEGDHVVRLSDHWTGQFGVGSIRECKWYLTEDRPLPNMDVTARCDYDEFRMIKKKTMKKRKKWSKRKT